MQSTGARLAMIFLALALSMVVAMTLGVPPAASAEEEGEELYRTLCLPCHGAGGKGDGPAAKTFTPPPADFTLPDFQNSRTDDDLWAAIKEGKGNMAKFGDRLDDEQIDLLVEFIRSLAP